MGKGVVSGWGGGEGRCNREVKFFVKIKKKNVFFFLGGGGGFRLGGGGMGGQGGCERKMKFL